MVLETFFFSFIIIFYYEYNLNSTGYLGLYEQQLNVCVPPAVQACERSLTQKPFSRAHDQAVGQRLQNDMCSGHSDSLSSISR